MAARICSLRMYSVLLPRATDRAGSLVYCAIQEQAKMGSQHCRPMLWGRFGPRNDLCQVRRRTRPRFRRSASASKRLPDRPRAESAPGSHTGLVERRHSEAAH